MSKTDTSYRWWDKQFCMAMTVRVVRFKSGPPRFRKNLLREMIIEADTFPF